MDGCGQWRKKRHERDLETRSRAAAELHLCAAAVDESVIEIHLLKVILGMYTAQYLVTRSTVNSILSLLSCRGI